MIELFRRACLFTCGVAVLGFGGTAAFGACGDEGEPPCPVLELRAVAINGVANQGDFFDIDAMPGDTVTVEMFWSGWGATRPGENPQLKTFQAKIQGRNAYIREDGAVMVLPAGWDTPPVVLCETNADCLPVVDDTPSCGVGGADFCIRTCPPTICSTQFPEFPVCAPVGYCVGEDHNPSAFNFTCRPPGQPCPGIRTDFCHAGPGLTPFPAIRMIGLDFTYGSTTLQSAGPTDTGGACYGGTLTLILQPDACGSIVVDAEKSPDFTFVELVDSQDTAHQPSVQPLTINLPDSCPVIVPKLVSTEPEVCLVDHRYPHSPESNQPPFWFNDNFEFVLNFDGAPTDNGGVFQQSDFQIIQLPEFPTLPLPSITFFEANNEQVTFRLNRPALSTKWTCIEYLPCTGSVSECMACWARLPGDVNGDRTVNASDLTELIGIVESGSPAVLRDCDMDRSGRCEAPDIIGWIDVFNGGGAFVQWGGLNLTPCPAAQ